MGRSVARFLAAGHNAAGILAAANSYGSAAGMHVEGWAPNSVYLKKGSVWWTGERVLVVTAADAPGGADVQVEAWVSGLAELSADPRPIVGMVPRRDMWRIASGFVAGLGVNPEAVFAHY